MALLYLKHAYNLSDEALVERWAERVPFQFFNGGEHYEHRIPCDPTQIGRFWKDLGIRPIFLAQILVALFQENMRPRELDDANQNDDLLLFPT